MIFIGIPHLQSKQIFNPFTLLILDSSASALLNQLIEEEHELIEKAQKTLDAAKTFLADMKANENELTSETPETSTGKVFRGI